MGIRRSASAPRGEGLSLLEKGLGCTLPESQQEGGLSVGAVGPQGASPWRDHLAPERGRARSFAPWMNGDWGRRSAGAIWCGWRCA